MAVPRNRHSNARKNIKRSHHAKVKKNLCICGNCKKTIMPHRICNFCGFYGNKQRISTQVAKD